MNGKSQLSPSTSPLPSILFRIWPGLQAVLPVFILATHVQKGQLENNGRFV